MSFEITGKLIVKEDTKVVSEKFKKREFVIETAEEIAGNVYVNFAKMQLVQNKCDILDRYSVGESIKVTFNIKGNKWEKDGKVNYITSLDAWKIENANAAPNTNANAQYAPAAANTATYAAPATNYSAPPAYAPSSEPVDDLPF